MALLSVMVVVVLIAGGVLGLLFFMLGKEGHKEEVQAVPLADLKEFGQGLSRGSQVPAEVAESQEPESIGPSLAPLSEPGPKENVMAPLQLHTQAQDMPQGAEHEEPYKKKVEELENELQVISQKADSQSQEARQMIDALTKENEQLKSQQTGLQEAQEKLIQMQGQTVDLSGRNEALTVQLDSANSKVRLLEEEMFAVKKQMGDELAKADAAIEQLQAEKEALAAAPPSLVDDAARRELEDLKSQCDQLKKTCEESEQAHVRLKEINAHLAQKVESLEYELVKMRAQATGLDRLSRNYKMQLDDLTQKLKEAQVGLQGAKAQEAG